MEITRDVILDLLPVYLSGEASDDTRRLIDAHLAIDPELAAAARGAEHLSTLKEDTMTVSTDLQLAAFKEAKRHQQRMTMIWAGLASIGLFGAASLALLAVRMLRG